MLPVKRREDPTLETVQDSSTAGEKRENMVIHPSLIVGGGSFPYGKPFRLHDSEGAPAPLYQSQGPRRRSFCDRQG